MLRAQVKDSLVSGGYPPDQAEMFAAGAVLAAAAAGGVRTRLAAAISDMLSESNGSA
jgi:hypothetical protein